MNFFAKLRALWRRPQPPVTPPARLLDKEFLEAIAKLPRERYQPPRPGQAGGGSTAEQGQTAA